MSLNSPFLSETRAIQVFAEVVSKALFECSLPINELHAVLSEILCVHYESLCRNKENK